MWGRGPRSVMPYPPKRDRLKPNVTICLPHVLLNAILYPFITTTPGV